MIGRHTFSSLAPVLGPQQKKAMSASFAVDGGQQDTKSVTFELLMNAAFVADAIWGFMLETACMYVFLWFYVVLRTYSGT